MNHDFNWGGTLVALAIILAMFVVPAITFVFDDRKKRIASREGQPKPSASEAMPTDSPQVPASGQPFGGSTDPTTDGLPATAVGMGHRPDGRPRRR